MLTFVFGLLALGLVGLLALSLLLVLGYFFAGGLVLLLSRKPL